MARQQAFISRIVTAVGSIALLLSCDLLGSSNNNNNFGSVVVNAAGILDLALEDAAKEKRNFRFALCPKSIDNPFFDVSRDGCVDRARALSTSSTSSGGGGVNGDGDNNDDDSGITIECLYVGPTEFNPDGIEQAQIVLDMILNSDNEPIDGLSISVTNPIPMLPVIQLAVAEGIPVVTFDSDDPNSGRASYIGTDNYFFGEQLGKVLKQINPNGGTFVIVSDPTPNILDRERGVRDSLLLHGDNKWKELTDYSPINMQGNNSLAIDLMRDVATKSSTSFSSEEQEDGEQSLTAIIPVMGGPMFLPDRWKELVDEFRNITFVVADGLAIQLELLSRRYAHGLVAQLPYEMGSMSIDSLLQLATTRTQQLDNFQGTNVLYHLQVPLVLPELNVDENNLNKLSILGYTLFTIIGSTCIYLGYWTHRHRRKHVVRAAQPEFLLMIVLGSFLMSLAIIPLSFDDSSPNYKEWHGKLFCMSIPWLIFCGFTIIFTALFAKTWRVTRLFQAQRRFERITVPYKQVSIIFLILFGSNVVVLLCWTIMNPLHYVRKDGEGLDAWGRIISTYGTCEAINKDINEDGSLSSSSRPYLIVLGLINVGVLGIANWQAYVARKIEVELSESQYISIAVGSLLQAGLIGTPLLVLVNDLPQAFYLTMVFMLFIIPMVILLLIFVPKFNKAKRSAGSQLFLVKQAAKHSHDNMSIQGGGGPSHTSLSNNSDTRRRQVLERRNPAGLNLPNQAEQPSSSFALPNSTYNTPMSRVSMGTSLVMESLNEHDETHINQIKKEEEEKEEQQAQSQSQSQQSIEPTPRSTSTTDHPSSSENNAQGE